jgi:methylase of polypeptide subunit release factors
MEYPSINIQGNIISGEILDRIRSEDIKYQQTADFGLDRKTTVRDEIGIAWAAARAHWTAFKLRIDRLKAGETGAAETRNSWMIPLLRELGYDVEKSSAFVHPDTQKTYAISHRAANLNGFPIHIMGYHDDLNQRRETSGPRLSPHALTQEYLNITEHVYALVTNGRFLRLLRDATRLVRLSYLEVDLEKMMEEELYSDFAILFRLLHASRMPKGPEQNEESYIEYYHQESLASGSRIREKLSKAVEESIKELANGFLKHKENKELRLSVNSSLPPAGFYLYQLRLIYRLLFLIVTEERNLVFPEIKEESKLKNRKIYYDNYSIERLRKLALRLNFVDGRKHDLWEGLKTTFLLFESGTYGEKIGIKPLGSGLFSPDALGILMNYKLSNASLLKVIRHLTLFENDQNQLVRVNYSDLDVEEFGSVYEGLLEYNAGFTESEGQPRFVFIKGSERSKTGSHYTPEELVKPLIKHSLDYIIEEKLKQPDKEKALLSIRVCDVACGSGHILLSAARRIAVEIATVRTREDQPSPEAIRIATRDVIRNCIYGVDKNPLAVELCKVALWLESHNPGEPLGFLDHHIKCGDSIVGLAHIDELKNGIPNEAFKSLPGDDKEIASAFLKRNKIERGTEGQLAADFENTVSTKMANLIEAFNQFNRLPENTATEILTKEKEYKRLIESRNWQKLKEIANLMVAQFFIPKTLENKDSLVTHSNYLEYLYGTKGVPGQVLAKSIVVSIERNFFHWFLEFPEIFLSGGFDCILGNPPYLGGSYIATNYTYRYFEVLKYLFNGTKGRSDLVAYFFRRIYGIIKNQMFLSLISTNSISQGESAEGALKIIINNGGTINFAKTNTIWPGEATVTVHLLSIVKGFFPIRLLNNKLVDEINYLLKSDNLNLKTYSLKESSDLSFKGTSLYGEGFLISESEKERLILSDNKNRDVIFPYLGGREVNENLDSTADRFAINFFDWSIEKAQEYHLAFKIIEEKVKPFRENVINNSTQIHEYDFWKYWDKRSEHYNKIKNFNRVLITARVNKGLAFVFVPNNQVFSDSLVIFKKNSFSFFAVLQSNIHFTWIINFFTTQGSTPVYIESKVLNNYPFPRLISRVHEKGLDQIGENYHKMRIQFMLGVQIGLTKTYNLFHSKELHLIPETKALYDDKTFEKKFGKEALQLIKHLTKTQGTVSIIEAVSGIIKLRELHVRMDEAVLEAYGWSDIQLRHDFYELDYLPENDRVRYTIHPDARREILKRLLELNHKIHEEEVTAGLWDSKGGSKKSKKSITETGSVEEPEGGYGGLFAQNK